jgi:cation:H+ antiporter
MIVYLQLAGGLVILLAGGELLVRGSISIANRLHISSIVIGLTVVAFGTSAPEFGVSLKAVLEGSSGVAIGTIVGSNVANILLVLGVPALIIAGGHRTSSVLRDVDLMVGSGILLLAFAANGSLASWEGAVMFVLLGAYLYASYRRARDEITSQKAVKEDIKALDHAPPSMTLSLLFIGVGIVGLWGGSQVLVPAAVSIAGTMGVSDKVIGVALVAVGTSLPELATSAVAAFRKHGDVAIGNVVGSNIFNILGVLGLTAAISPIPVGMEILAFDMWVMIGISLLLIPYALRQRTVGRIGGLTFLVLYAGFISLQFTDLPSALAASDVWPPW